LPDSIDQEIFGVTSWRRLWHLIGGSTFPVLALFIARDILLIFLGAVTALFVAWEIVRFISPSVNRWMASRLRLILKRKERFQLTGSTYLLFASLVVFFFFEKYVAVTSLLFLSIGDFMAATIGQKYGRHRLFKKSLEGSLACLVSCFLIGVVMTQTDSGMALPVALAGAFSATVVELLPIPVDDNFTVPLFSAGVMALTALALG
jgi:glycerol-3-phosphate acyltransferase PlsY